MTLPSAVDENPHCGLIASCSSGDLRSIVNAALESVLGFKLGELRADEAQDDLFAFRQETQWRETTRSLIVIFEKITVHGNLARWAGP